MQTSFAVNIISRCETKSENIMMLAYRYNTGKSMQQNHLYHSYPSALVGNPFGDLFCHDEFADEADYLGEEAANTALQHCDRHPVAET